MAQAMGAAVLAVVVWIPRSLDWVRHDVYDSLVEVDLSVRRHL